MGILRILKRAIRPNKRRDFEAKTGLIGPSAKRKVEGNLEEEPTDYKIETAAAITLVIVSIAVLFLLLNIDTRAVIRNRNDPTTR